jgi:hypothetical protein
MRRTHCNRKNPYYGLTHSTGFVCLWLSLSVLAVAPGVRQSGPASSDAPPVEKQEEQEEPAFVRWTQHASKKRFRRQLAPADVPIAKSAYAAPSSRTHRPLLVATNEHDFRNGCGAPLLC